MRAGSLCSWGKYGVVIGLLCFNPKALRSQTQHTDLGGGERHSKMLDPGMLPDWLATGKFRSARWDGGPIEAEKGVLSGWADYKEGDPIRMLEATRDWYNPRTIEYLKVAHINWAWVTWSNGFSPATEQQQRSLLTRYIRLCHENQIHVAAYISIGNIFWRDMFEHIPSSRAWVKRDFGGGPLFYSHPNRYMADITNPDWIALQKERVGAAVRAGADALWVDNTFSYYRMQDVSHLLDVLYETAAESNSHFVIMSNYNQGIYTWGRLQNGITTEDGDEPGYYTDKKKPYLVTNSGLLRYNLGIAEGWRPVSIEDGRRHNGDRMLTPMKPHKWQLAIAECAMNHAALELYFEGRFLHDVYFRTPEAIESLGAIGKYNAFLERNEQYLVQPQSMSQVAVLSDATDTIVPYLNQLAANRLDYDVVFNYQSPSKERLSRYKAIILPNTNPLSSAWRNVLETWVHEDGGLLILVEDASLFSPENTSTNDGSVTGTLLGVTKNRLPSTMQMWPRGKGTVIYLPKLPPAEGMLSVVREARKLTAPVEVEPHLAVLSTVAYQAKWQRVILQLVNYRQRSEKGIHVTVRVPVERVDSFSPDSGGQTRLALHTTGERSTFVVPELQTYDLVVIELKHKLN